MKTRIVYPQLWLDKNYKRCSLETKVLFSFLINNPFLGLSRYSRIDDEQICFSTGLKESQLEKAKGELQVLKWCYFYDGEWIYHNHECAYMDFDGRDRVIEAKNKELSNVPQVVIDKVKGLLTGSEPVLNPKPEIINPKPVKEIPKKITEATFVLQEYNRIFKKELKSAISWEKNLVSWLDVYSVSDIIRALEVAKKDQFWKDKMTPEILLRRKNPRGEDCDRIGEMLAKERPQPAVVVSTFTEPAFIPVSSEKATNLINEVRRKVRGI